MKKQAILIVFVLFVFNAIFAQSDKVLIDGELKKWHKITLSFEGENLSENGDVNPFLDYRLMVKFTNGDTSFEVPGFFAADGAAAETSSGKGKVWKVRFRPNLEGEWTYKVSFRAGKAIAVSDAKDAGKELWFDGVSGKITVGKSDKKGDDFRAKGRLAYTDKGYLQFQETKDYFLKGGADSPESFLGYYEFDQTPASHKYEAHAGDWKEGNPTWKNGKGKNIIGALNYLKSKQMNSVYFLTMNVQGDGKDVWPWNDVNERYRFDCSKLDQWEIVFDHMDSLGLMLHVVTQETENELLLDIGELKTQRKLYYRELIARFGHHLGVTWNLGEENGPLHWTPKGQTDKDREDMARYIKTHDPYKGFVVLHTHADPKAQDLFLEPLLGNENLDGPSFQTHNPKTIHGITKKWIDKSRKAGKRWIACQDEIGPADKGALPDAVDPEHNEIRNHVLWSNLMAGGAGVEWYFGYKYAHNDLNCEDWRSRDILWDQTHHALEFFQNYLPFTEMKSADGLTKGTSDYVFAKNGSCYAIYIPEVKENVVLDLFGVDGKFDVKWYNPRTGGKLQKGSVRRIYGGKEVSIGTPPSKNGDWVALVVNKKKMKPLLENTPVKMELNALKDFTVSQNSEAVYYIDKKTKVLGINAGNKNYRDVYASAKMIFNGETGMYKAMFVSFIENDGESDYKINVNGETIATVQNKETKKPLARYDSNLGVVYLEKGDVIEVMSKAVTNGKIPENDETAWARGRWQSIFLTPSPVLNLKSELKNVKAFSAKNGIIEVEAEAFHFKSDNGSPRDWYVRKSRENIEIENLENHMDGASNGSYIEALPDTRVTHDDVLTVGENFFPFPGYGGMVAYKVKIKSPGKYYVWTRAYSSGPEDNGLHVGLNNKWPESGQRIQLCQGKNKWTWTSAQRVPENHCGVPNTIYLEFPHRGEYVVTFSMREDGFEFDKFILTKNKNYKPKD